MALDESPKKRSHPIVTSPSSLEALKNTHLIPPSSLEALKISHLIPPSGLEGLKKIQPQGERFCQMADLMKGMDLSYHNSILAAANLSLNFENSLGTTLSQIAKEMQDAGSPITRSLAAVIAGTTVPNVWGDLVTTSTTDLLKTLQNPLTPIPTTEIPLIPMHDLSPTMRLADIITPLLTEKNSKERIGTILEKSLKRPQEVIKEELLEISKSNGDIRFNCSGYEFLFKLEVFLRDMIDERIISPCQNKREIQNYIDSKILDEWESRKEAEEIDKLICGDYRLIDYSDFTHLKMIFERGRNEKKFEDLVNQQQYKSVIGKLHELDPIRKKIAHSRILTEKEYSRLVLYANDISTLMKPSV